MILSLAFILTGFTSTVTQAMLVRELVAVFLGNELSLGIIFSSWLFWVAAGSFFLGRLVDRIKNKLRSYISFQILLSLILIPILLGIKGIRPFWHIPPGELIGFFPFVISVFLVLAPVGLILGFQFALACRLYAQKKSRTALQGKIKEASLDFQNTPKTAGKVYRLDALGDMFGGVTFAYLFVNIFQSFETAASLAILNLALAITLSLIVLKKKILSFLGFSLLLVFTYGLGSPLMHNINGYANRLEWKGMNFQATDFSKYSDYAVIKDESSFYIYGDGQLKFSLPEKALPEEIIHLSLSQIENPGRILLIGGGISGAIREALKYPALKEIFYLEKDSVFIRLAERYIGPKDRNALTDARTKIVFGDGRLFIKDYQGEKFDGIILNAGNPLTAESNRFYTLEFFNEVKRILNPRGIFFLGVDSHENYLSPEMRKFNACIYQTLKEAFPHIILFPGGTLYLVASSSPDFLTDNPQVLSRRLKRRGIFSQYINEGILPQRLSPERLSYIQEILLSEEKGRLNRDFHPISYYYNLILWGSRIFPENRANIFWRLSRIKFSRLALGLILAGFVLMLFRPKSGKGFIPLVVSIGGLAGISLELILIIGFQIIYGNLYFMIGVIVASFMLGLVAGAGFITRRLDKIKKKYLTLGRIELGLGIYALFIALSLLMLNLWPSQPLVISTRIIFPLLTVFCGIWVGMLFPLANDIYLAKLEAVGRTAGKLYAFDLMGACLGSLATAVFLIPLFGLIQTAFLIGLICLLGFLLVSILNHV